LDLIDVEIRQLRVGAARVNLPAGQRRNVVYGADHKTVPDVAGGTFSALRSLLFCGMDDSNMGERKSGALLRFFDKV